MNLLHLPATLGPFLWQALAQATILLGLAVWLARFVPTARARAALLHAALTLSILCPLLSALLPHYVFPASVAPAWSPFTEPPPTSPVHPSARPLATVVTALTLLWAAGVAFHLLRMAYGWWIVSRLLRFAVPLDSPRIKQLVQQIDPGLRIRLLTLPGTSGAFCWQTHRPVLVLSPAALKLPDAELELLLRHEIAHLRSGDPLRLFLEQLAAAAYWFHPLVYWIAREAARWRELACDDWVISTGGSPTGYAGLLTTMAAQRAGSRPAFAKLRFGGAPSHLIQRVRRLAGRHTTPARPRRALQPAAVTSLAAAALLLALVRIAQPLADSHRNHWTPWPKPTAR